MFSLGQFHQIEAFKTAFIKISEALKAIPWADSSGAHGK